MKVITKTHCCFFYAPSHSNLTDEGHSDNWDICPFYEEKVTVTTGIYVPAMTEKVTVITGIYVPVVSTDNCMPIAKVTSRIDI